MWGQKKEELPGLSNNGPAQAGGYPSSGAMQPGGASPKALPNQRAGEPFQATPPPNAGSARGTLNGSAVAGAQFKTTPQPMSPGVASYVSIPQSASKFVPPGGALPPGANVFQGSTQPSYFAGNQPQQQPQQAAGRAPGAATMPQASAPPPMQQNAAQAGAEQPLPTASSPAWMPNNVEQFGQGSPWQQAQAAQFALQQQQNLQAQNTAAGLRGRGGSVQTTGAGYQNLLGDVAFAGQMAEVQQQAAQQDFQNQMQYTQQLSDMKLKIMAAAKDMGITIDEEGFNAMAAEILGKYGEMPSPGTVMEALTNSKAGAGASEEKKKVLSAAINNGDGATIAAAVKKLSKAEAQSIPADWWNQALSESWGKDDDAIRAFMVANGIPIPN